MANHTPDVLGLQLRTLPLHRILLRSIEARLFWELDEERIEPILDVACSDGTFAQRDNQWPY